VSYPGAPHLWHSTANVGGNGGAEQKKSNDRSDNRWNLPHEYVSPLLDTRWREKSMLRCSGSHEKARTYVSAPVARDGTKLYCRIICRAEAGLLLMYIAVWTLLAAASAGAIGFGAIRVAIAIGFVALSVFTWGGLGSQ
jgi:hypothetical protein